MPAVLINAAAVFLGGLTGSLLGSAVRERFTRAIMSAIGFVTLVIGVQSALKTSNIIYLVTFTVLGTLIGVWLRLDERMDKASDNIKKRLAGTRFAGGSFGEAFISTSMLFCVGAMTVVGSIEAGLNRNYELLLTKSVMDFVSAIAFSAALGSGVIFSSITVLVIQGAICLLAGAAAPLLTPQLITEMSAASGPLFIAMGFNLTGLCDRKAKTGDMLPAVFLPLLYFPLAGLFH